MSERDVREFYIPPNFQSGVSIFGKTFEIANLAEGAILALLPIVVIFVLLPNFGVTIPWKTSSTIVTFASVILGYLGIAGINGYTITQFIKSMLRYRKNKRICYYNPRVKSEAAPYSLENIAEQMLPKEKLAEFYKNAKSVYEEKQRKTALAEQSYLIEDRKNMYFTDDIGVVDTPVEYMDKKEYKAYKKKKKQEARQKKREKRKKRTMKTKTEKKTAQAVNKKGSKFANGVTKAANKKESEGKN